MIINKFVFPIKADLKFVEGGIPQGYLTANDINKDMFYVISPTVGDTIVSANFQNNVLNEEPVKVEFTPSSLKVSELVSENESYYELVKDWNVWQGFMPSKPLEYVAYNRAGEIGISFSFSQYAIPKIPEDIDFKGEVFEASQISGDGVWVVKTTLFEYEGFEFGYNDLLIRLNGNVIQKKSILRRGNTGTVNYSVDPSVYDTKFEEVEFNLVEELLGIVNETKSDYLILDKKVDLLDDEFDNYYQKHETYERVEIDDKDANVLQQAKDYAHIINALNEDRLNTLELEKEDKENKRADLENSNNTTYPTTKAVKDGLDLKVDKSVYNQKVNELESGLDNRYTKDETHDKDYIDNELNKKLESQDIADSLNDVLYDPNTHKMTFERYDGVDIVIDLPIEALIENISLDGNDLVLTYEDGTTTSVPLNTLLVGVVKEVNGKTPNSSGVINLNYSDLNNLPNLFSGDYNDLTNKPSIPSKTSDLTNDSDFAKNADVVPKTRKINGKDLSVDRTLTAQDIDYILGSETIFDRLKDTYRKDEVLNIINQLKTALGWSDSDLGKLENNDTYTVDLDYNFIILEEHLNGEVIPYQIVIANMENVSYGNNITLNNGVLTYTGSEKVYLTGYKTDDRTNLVDINNKFIELKKSVEEALGKDTIKVFKGASGVRVPENAAKSPMNVEFGYEDIPDTNLVKPNISSTGWEVLADNGSIKLEYNLQEGGLFRVNGTGSSLRVNFGSFEIGKTYTGQAWSVANEPSEFQVKYGPTTSSSGFAYLNTNRREYSKDTREAEIDYGQLYIGGSFTYDNYTFRLQIEEGSEATEYTPPYYSEFEIKPETNLRFSCGGTKLYLLGDRALNKGEWVSYDSDGYFIYDGVNKTYIRSEGLLISKPNQEVVIEHINKETLVYSNGLSYNQNFEIGYIDNISGFNEEGILINYDVGNAFVDEGKIFHPELNDGDIVIIEYNYLTNATDVVYDFYYNVEEGSYEELLNRVEDIEVRLDNLESGNQEYNLKNYEVIEEEAVTQILRDNYSPNKFTFVLLADTQTDDAQNEQTNRVFEEVKSFINKNKYIDALIHLGDWNNSNVSGDTVGKKEFINSLKHWSALFAKIDIPKIIVRGNHDDGAYGQSLINTTPETIVSRKEWIDIMYLKNNIKGSFNIHEDNSLYYFKDFPNKKTRLIHVDMTDFPEETTSSGSVKYTARSSHGLRERQLKWLINDALNLKKSYNDYDEWSVAIFTHKVISPDFDYYGGALEDEGRVNYTAFKNILNDFVVGGTGSYKNNKVDFEVDIDWDFTNQGSMKLIGLFAGHGHFEVIGKSNENNFYEIVTNTATAHNKRKHFGSVINELIKENPDRILGNISETAWSIVIVDKLTDSINIIKYGAGTNRHIKYSLNY